MTLNVYSAPVIVRLYFDVLSAAVCCPKCRNSRRLLYITLRLVIHYTYRYHSFLQRITRNDADVYSRTQCTISFEKSLIILAVAPFPIHRFNFLLRLHAHIGPRARTLTHTRGTLSSCFIRIVHRHACACALDGWRLATAERWG